MKLFVGLDISSEKIDACFMTDDSNLSILNRLSVANDLNGASEIKALILKHHAEVSFEQIVIG
ncbi:IS110 family transposase, partial [Latilactobacillus curvatus]|nr:IS110 family transposase [Latilactobacillus curvatus]MCW8780847.1 IS110 family transposase [Latilactobacillus curvatus]